jgi:hypothetical protein
LTFRPPLRSSLRGGRRWKPKQQRRSIMISIVRYEKDNKELKTACPLFLTVMIGSAFCHCHCPHGMRFGKEQIGKNIAKRITICKADDAVEKIRQISERGEKNDSI